MNFKSHIHQACLEILHKRIDKFQENLNDLSKGAQNDAKSTAGDKHETANAMMQIEREKVSRILMENLEMKAIMQKLENMLPTTSIKHGSLVKTNSYYIYISVALGRIIVDQKSVIVISPKSPLGSKIIGLTVGSSAEVNGTVYVVESIY